VRQAIEAGDDPIGDAFCRIRSGEARRDLGQFYTPSAVITAMNLWVLGNDPVRAVDGGCGSGRYAVALRRSGFTGQVIAVDVDPLATLMTRAHAIAAGVGSGRPSAELPRPPPADDRRAHRLSR
jgi:ribosomal protein L11 methylase PrmA